MRVLLLIVIAAALLATPAMAGDLMDAQAESAGVGELERALPDSAREVLGDALVEDALDTESMLERFWSGLKDRLAQQVRRGVGGAAAVIAAALLCSLAFAMADDAVGRYVELGGVLAVAAIACGDANSFILQGQSALQELSDFSRALLPCLTTAAAAGGAVTSAAAKYAATALFMDVALTAAKSVVLPLIYGYLAASVASSALGSESLSGAAKLMKWLALTVMGLTMTAFTTYLSISGAVTGAADAVAVKAAKTTISTVLPVVGGIISDAASTVIAGAGLLKSAIGVFGLMAVAGVCARPFVSLGAAYLVYKAAGAISGAFAPGRVSGLIGAVGSVFGMVLGLVGSGAVMLFVSIISIVKAVSG